MAAPWLLQAFYTTLLGSSSVPKSVQNTYVTVSTQDGPLRGQWDNTLSTPVAKFEGIPFAAPPIGLLRFRPPAPPAAWSGVRDALQFGNECIQAQYAAAHTHVTRSEDCLYLNVYTPTHTSALPVMVWIHGGGYIAGAASHYDLTSLPAKGVVIVSTNYRLGHFGFMSTEDDVMPGNYGMLDLVQALEWVKRNIRYFGGDPDRVTIFGQSAGGGAVALLQLSPLAKNLFHRVISQSGSSLAPWSTTHAGNRVSPKTLVRLVGNEFQCGDINNSTNVMICLQNVDADVLFNVSQQIVTAFDILNGIGVLAPRVETTFGFLPDLPINLLTKALYNKVDRVTGYNSDELVSLVYGWSQANKSIDDIIDLTLAYGVNQFTTLTQGQLQLAMRSAFLGGAGAAQGGLRGALTALDALEFVSPALVEFALLARDPRNKMFLYEFHYTQRTNRLPWMAAEHGGELGYLFNINVTQLYNKRLNMTVTPEMVSVSEQMMAMWTNFAKTGNPALSDTGFAWLPYASTTPRYMFMDAKPEMKILNKPDLTDFYRKVVQKMDGFMIDVQSHDNIVG